MIGDESLLFVRGDDGLTRGFYNLCRHRGTRLVEEAEGKKLRSIVCPYHAWAFSTEGGLVGAPHTEDLVNFRREDYGLLPVRMESWGGFLWVNLDEKAPPLQHEL